MENPNVNTVIDPEIGMGATVCYWSDRHAGTIIEVSKNCVLVQHDKAIRTDSNGMSDMQTYSYERNPQGQVMEFTLRKNGRWIQRGSDMKNGVSLVIGHRREYYDFSF